MIVPSVGEEGMSWMMRNLCRQSATDIVRDYVVWRKMPLELAQWPWWHREIVAFVVVLIVRIVGIGMIEDAEKTRRINWIYEKRLFIFGMAETCGILKGNDQKLA
jgi:hypothetical protein